jgi:hypothetical protein
MNIIYPSFGRFFWSSIKQLIIILLMGMVIVFFRWKFENHPHLNWRLGWVAAGAMFFGLCPFRWFLLVPKMIEIHETAMVVRFYFRKSICVSFEDIDKYESQGMGVVNIRLKNGQNIMLLPSPYSDQEWTQLLNKPDWADRP